MAHYGSSIFYPIVGNSHNQILRYVAGALRQPVFLINGVIASLSDGGIPEQAKVALLDDQEHVVTVELSSPSAQFSQSHKDIAVACAHNGWLEVRQ
jgi:hypothetical protein